MNRLILASISIGGALLLGPPAYAAERNCQLHPEPPTSPRVVSAEFDGQRLNVLLPVHYAERRTRRYPVLYLFHGRGYSENSWLAATDLETFTARLDPESEAIVVMPPAGPDAWHVDYFDGRQQWESFHRRLIAHVDATFRTIADRSARAVAGHSVGGHGALAYAARMPDLFAVGGSFSGLVHLTFPESPYTGPTRMEERQGSGAPGPARGPVERRPYESPRPACGSGGDALGDRTRHAWNWHGHNPADLVRNLRATRVYLAAGTGTPCGPDDASEPALLAAIEPGIREMNERLAVTLAAEGVPHHFERSPCGVHNMRAAQRALPGFWQYMVDAFHGSGPASFDMRATEPEFAAWGWTLRADAARSPQFLEVREARRGGFRLIGSGTTTVVTGPNFAPGSLVRVTGAEPSTARADQNGRVTLRVDLGEPVKAPQFSGSDSAHVARSVELASLPSPPGRLRVRFRRSCALGRARLTFRPARRHRLVSAVVTVNGRAVRRLRGRALRETVRLRRLPAGRLRIAVEVLTAGRHTLRGSRRARACPKPF